MPSTLNERPTEKGDRLNDICWCWKHTALLFNNSIRYDTDIREMYDVDDAIVITLLIIDPKLVHTGNWCGTLQVLFLFHLDVFIYTLTSRDPFK